MSECFGKLSCWAAGLLVCLSAQLSSQQRRSADSTACVGETQPTQPRQAAFITSNEKIGETFKIK